MKQTSEDIANSYFDMLTNIEKIKDALIKLVAQQAIKSIDVTNSSSKQ